ncbi:MAG: hypothetical protein D6694_07415 [Gammaproteobacteria bacterium]|nr:MAG: hypothetical protein D6694_07415 [Gammaproteobacteria bacterium]
MKLKDIVRRMNDEMFITVEADTVKPFAKDIGHRYTDVLLNQLKERDDPERILRGSTLGKPTVELFAKRFFPEWWSAEMPSERLMRLFHEGFVFELQFEWFLRRVGFYKVRSAHQRYDLRDALECNVPVSGELDYVLETEDGRYLIDTKTASSNSYRKLTSGTVPREYLVQQAVYKAAWELTNGERIDRTGLLVYNKDNSTVMWVEADPVERDEMLDYAKALCYTWEKSDSWDEAIANGVRPPDPVPEIYRKRPTGAFLLPDSMKYQPQELIEACYELVEDKNGYGKDTLYVLGSRW